MWCFVDDIFIIYPCPVGFVAVTAAVIWLPYLSEAALNMGKIYMCHNKTQTWTACIRDSRDIIILSMEGRIPRLEIVSCSPAQIFFSKSLRTGQNIIHHLQWLLYMFSIGMTNNRRISETN